MNMTVYPFYPESASNMGTERTSSTNRIRTSDNEYKAHLFLISREGVSQILNFREVQLEYLKAPFSVGIFITGSITSTYSAY
jgi:hypothetical protein